MHVNRDVLQETVDAIPQLFFHKDVNNRILRVNAAAAAAVGTTVEAMVGSHASDWFPDEAGQYFEDDLSVIETGLPKLGIVEQLQVEDGTKRRIRTDKFPSRGADGEVDGIIVLIEDISSEAISEEALQRSERRLRTILESTPECVLVLEPGGRLSDINPAGLELFEAETITEMQSISMFDVVVPEHHSAVADFVRAIAVEGSRVLEVEIIGLKGRPRWIEAHGSHLAGEPGAYVTVCRDITERRLAEVERERLEAELRHSHRIESIGTLASGIAHDFNNSLMVIMGNAENALDALDPESREHRQITAVLRAAGQAAGVCDQLLSYTGKRTVELVTSQLTDLVDVNREFLRSTIPSHHDLHFDLAEHLADVDIDRVQVIQLIINLLNNASEAISEQPGRIDVKTEMREFSASELSTCVSGAFEPGRYVVLSVTDSGAGMPPDVVVQAADPFFTTKFGGRGLGLAMVFGTVIAQAGALRIVSAQGVGTTVQVLLPPAEAAVRAAGDDSIEPTASSSETILLVDDDDMVRETLKLTFESFGFSVITVGRGADALELFDRGGHNVSAVVLDVMMPELSGPETYQRLARVAPDMAVLFSSGSPKEATNLDLDDLDHVAFIQKPYTGTQIVSKVRQLIAASGI